MHFFIDHLQLQLAPQAPIDRYGADSTDPTNFYNITSRFQLVNEAKAFACVKGMMIVQQSVVDNSLVNLIIKPSDSLTIPLNVKYYIYRGIKKDSLISGTNIVPAAATNNELIARIWAKTPVPSSYAAGVLGFDNNTIIGTSNVDVIYNSSHAPIKATLVNENEWIGTFTKDYKIGFEVILDSDRFNVTLDYIRAERYQVNVTGLVGFAERFKREEVLYFMDPVALFGMHYTSGVHFSEYSAGKVTDITVSQPQTHTKYIFSKLLEPFSTKYRVYFDVRSEKGYSYNYYQNYADSITNDSIQVGYGTVVPTPQEYNTNDWPIIWIDNPQTTAQNTNTIRIKLRIDDNTKPIIYIENKDFKSTDNNSNFIKPSTILRTMAPGITDPDWSAELTFSYRNTDTTAAKHNVSTLIKLYYFRSKYNATSPNTVLKNEKYYDSPFCSIDMYKLGDVTELNRHSQSLHRSYIREPLHTAAGDLLGTGNFEYLGKNGAFWDSQRILFYSAREINNLSSDKMYVNTYNRKLNLTNTVYNTHSIRTNSEVICREYNIAGPQVIRILGINSFKIDQQLCQKESAMFLGLTIAEITAIKATAGLSTNHDRYIFLEPDAANPMTDTVNAARYRRYTVQVQGLNAAGVATRVTPMITANPIYVYSRDNQFFNSSGFGAIETNTSPGLNQIEFHIYPTGQIKINDNIDLSLIHDVQNVFYKYHAAGNVIHDICNLDIVQINKMGGGVAVANITPGYTSTINYVPYNVDVDTSYLYANGDVISEGAKTVNGVFNAHYKLLYRSLGKKTFLVNFPAQNFPALNISFTYSNTRRRYCSPEMAAVFLGALARVGFALTSTGSCLEDGTPFPSVAHNNGYAIDTLYLFNLANDQAFVNAMSFFGCSQILRGDAGYPATIGLPAVNGHALHNTHLHSGNGDHNVILNVINLDETVLP